MTSRASRAGLAIIVLLAVAPASGATDLETLRGNVVAYYAAAGGDRSDPLMSEALEALEHDVVTLTATDYLLSNGSWSDIDYDEVPSGVWSPWDHFRRLTILKCTQ